MSADDPTKRVAAPDTEVVRPEAMATTALPVGVAALPAAMLGRPVFSDETARPAFAGYTLGVLLGKGGMGEVVLAHDTEIGRDVALKRMLGVNRDDDAERRFLREARLQARLEHPAIVPVHELGRDATGRPYFTMKRLTGVTLRQRMPGSRQRLLRAFADVCRAVEFAHDRGVVHRDIKPTNIMLGDFGEVYLLDWGVARVIGDAAPAESTTTATSLVGLGGMTQAGVVMGTPGYMAPEQALGESITPALDIYALGCVLFEILAEQPLHPRGDGGAASAVARPTEAPSARRPDLAIPPELDAACVAALAEDPADRPTAGALARRIEDYLDGDRDLERRYALAAGQVAAARAALASGDPARRAEAVRAAGRALALHPESLEAADLVAGLLIEPPAVLPAALDGSLDAAAREASRVRSRTAMGAFAAMLLLVLAVPVLEVRSWPLLFGFVASMVGMVGVAWLGLRRGVQRPVIALVTTFAAIVISSRVGGPFLLTPVVVCGVTLGLMAIPPLTVRPWWVVIWVIATVATPVVLEATGVFAATWWVDGDTLRIRSAVLHSTNQTVETIVLVCSHVALIVMAGMFARAVSRDRREAERRLHIQAWHLRQLLPDRAVPGPATGPNDHDEHPDKHAPPP